MISFGTDIYRKHLEDQHGSKWAAYQELLEQQKTEFFNQRMPYGETINAYIGSENVRMYLIHRSVVVCVFKPLLIGVMQ